VRQLQKIGDVSSSSSSPKAVLAQNREFLFAFRKIDQDLRC